MRLGPRGAIIGVDGGGSRTRVRVVDAGGRRLGGAEGGPANVYLAPEAALATIAEAIDRAIAAAGLDDRSLCDVALGLGLAGISSAAVADRVERHFRDRFGSVRASDDATIACLGAHDGQDGGLVIAGTGSAALVRSGDHRINIGGRGFLLGDDGSGAVMGRQALRRALRAHDGLEPWSPFLRSLMAEFEDDPVAVISWGRTATSGQYGTYAPRILAAARERDPAAHDIVTQAAQAIDALIDATVRQGADRVALVGGLAAPLHPFLSPISTARLTPPLRDALDGALFLAGATDLASPDR